jgi:N-methylhydantoinase A
MKVLAPGIRSCTCTKMLPYPSFATMPRRLQTLRVAIDTGGTFTDCVWIDADSGHVRMLKVFSTPADPSEAIVEALRKIGHTGALVLLHGTTVGTNTLLERKGARTALVTTAGFEDVIEIGRQNRPKLYDFFFDRVEPLVPGDLRFGVEERTASDGEILTGPSAKDLKALAQKIAAKHPQSIAIALLFSFANPKNEHAVAEALESLGLPLSISHQILPEFREYERTSTVVINAYLQPVMQLYLQNLEARARRDVARNVSSSRSTSAQSPRIFVMQSSGGITALASAAREPVRTVLSGPAGGVVGAVAAARRSGFERIIAFDMGGTSTDVSLVDRAITTASQAEVAGFPVGVPMLDIHTVGAGGGSLARFDAAGVLHVGPESAGADPGPICYGRSLQPTVTDTNLLLGRLQPRRFLGGDFTLDLERTVRITRDWLKKNRSNLTLEKFAAGVIRVVNATMEKAIRVVSIERGRDPRDFALVAFGGAGGLHACALAESLSIPHVIVPAMPGALSALGILVSDVVKDYSRTVLWRLSGDLGDPHKLPSARLAKEFALLQKRAVKDFHSESWQGRVQYRRSVDLRYQGQGYELNLPFTKNLIADFQREHQQRYGYAHPSRAIELVTLRLRAVVKSPPLEANLAHVNKMVHVETAAPSGSSGQAPVRPSRAKLGSLSTPKAPVLFDSKKLRTAIRSRDTLQPGKKYSGPAIVTEYSATTVIPPGKRFHVDAAGNLIVTIR